MDLFKAQLEKLQQQLAGLNATQKMLVAALTAIMVITVVWWGKYAGEAEMVPLLNQSFSPTDLGRIEERLDAKGIHYTVSSDKLLVPTDKRMEILSDLTYSRLMPRNTQEGFDTIVKQMSAFDSQEKQRQIWTHGKELLLAQIIGSFPDVASADVMIDSTNEARIEGGVEPSATINITLRDGVKPNQKLVDAAADAVSGAQAGLNTNRIKVVVNGLAQKVHDADDPFSSSGPDSLALLQQHEASAEQKIRQNYLDIPGLLVSVTMKLNTTTVQTEKHDFDAKGAVQKAIESTVENDNTSGGGAAGGEAGAMPNTGMSVGAGGGGGGATQTHDKSDDKFTVMVPETRTVSHTPAGDATALGAALRVPLSYFSRLARGRDPSVKDPTYAQLKPLIDEEMPKMRDTVLKCVALPSATDVSIDTYIDDAPVSAPPVAAGAGGVGLTLLAGGHYKDIILGALAVMSLFMVSMMVRKATPAPLPAMDVAPDKKAGLTVAEALAGEAAAGEVLLDGMELNEDAVKTSQMVDQVSTLVRENPDAAASLIKKWMNRS